MEQYLRLIEAFEVQRIRKRFYTR